MTKRSAILLWYGCKEPHRPYDKGTGLRFGKKPEDVEVPAYIPDCEEVRSDLLGYVFELEWYVKQLGKMLEKLEELGELENTLVVVTADNGLPFPRAKADLYEHGTHVPMAISWVNRIPDVRKYR